MPESHPVLQSKITFPFRCSFWKCFYAESYLFAQVCLRFSPHAHAHRCVRIHIHVKSLAGKMWEHAGRWRQRVLHQPFGFPQDPNVDGLARSQGSGFDEQDTCSAASGYAFVFFVSFRTEKNYYKHFSHGAPCPQR